MSGEDSEEDEMKGYIERTARTKRYTFFFNSAIFAFPPGALFAYLLVLSVCKCVCMLSQLAYSTLVCEMQIMKVRI